VKRDWQLHLLAVVAAIPGSDSYAQNLDDDVTASSCHSVLILADEVAER
jgi:hypothetical protein